jgi:hypothetical protein
LVSRRASGIRNGGVGVVVEVARKGARSADNTDLERGCSKLPCGYGSLNWKAREVAMSTYESDQEREPTEPEEPDQPGTMPEEEEG